MRIMRVELQIHISGVHISYMVVFFFLIFVNSGIENAAKNRVIIYVISKPVYNVCETPLVLYRQLELLEIQNPFLKTWILRRVFFHFQVVF